MGNGPGITEDDLEQMVAQAAASFGQANTLLMGHQQMIQMMNALNIHRYSEFKGTPWSNKDRLTKREYKVAQIHTFLTKIKVLKFNDDEWEEIRFKTVKRLKRAKWAQYRLINVSKL